jgi:hypothetical protein
MGMSEELIQAHEKMVKSDELRRAFSAHGIKGYWRKHLQLAEKQPLSFNGYHWRAELYARAGQNDKAFEQLWKAYEARDHMMTQLKVNPVFDSLRSDPRFADLMRQINLKP